MQTSNLKQRFDEAYRLFSKLILGDQVRQGTSTTLKNALCNLYTMDENCQTLRYSRLSGMLTIDIDRKLKSTFFRMYSLDSFELIFECELYYGFEEQITETLWAFDFLEAIIAFQFPTTIDGEQIAAAVKKHSHKMTEYFGILQERRKDVEVKKKDETFFGKIKNMFSKDAPVKKQETKIISVKKESSITFDHSTGRFENIPPQFQMVFAQLGFTKKELQNKQTAQALMEDIIIYTTIKAASDDPNAVDLRKTVRRFNLQEVDTIKDQQNSEKLSLNIPPPPPGLPPSLNLLPPPQIPVSKRQDSSTNTRAMLLDQIRNNQIKLKPVVPNGNSTTVSMPTDKDQRQNLRDYLLSQLKKRNQALRPNVYSDSQDQND